jgi:hypothetical protein
MTFAARKVEKQSFRKFRGDIIERLIDDDLKEIQSIRGKLHIKIKLWKQGILIDDRKRRRQARVR